MRSPSTRVFTFLIGILLGMLAAIGLVFLMLNQFNPLAFFNNESKSSLRDTIVDMRAIKKVAPAKKIRKEEAPLPEIFTNESQFDSTDGSESEVESFIEGQEQIVIKRDEFLNSVELDVIHIRDAHGSQTRDSLLNKLQGNSDLKKTIRVEFWRSPVNYQGYRLLSNKIVLFGLAQEARMAVFKFNDDFYLKNGKTVYRISENDDFESLDKVTDDSILKALNP